MSHASPERVDEALIALRRILRAAELYARALANAAGLTPAQLRVLQIIGERGGSSTPKALSERMGVSQATVTALVDKLVARAFVTRMRSKTDRRQSNVSLTDAGRAALAEVPDALQQRFVTAFEALRDWEQAQLVSSLERVAAMMNATNLDSAPVLTTGEIGAGEAGD